MSIASYSDLKTDVADYLNRADLTARIPDFIALAESQMNTDLSARDMEAITSLSLTAGNAWTTLPTDMLEMRRLQITVGDRMIPLNYVSPNELTAEYPYQTSGVPLAFTVIGGQVQVAPVPDVAYTLSMTYQQRIPALSDANASNWVLSQWPNVYLYGSLCAAQPFLMNDERLPVFQALYAQGVKGVNQVNWYSGTTPRVRAK